MRDTRTFHPSCASRYDATHRATRAATIAPAPAVIGQIEGVALSFDPAGCGIVTRDGGVQHERFAPGCFDDCALEGVALKINHAGGGLRGRFTRIFDDGGELRFTFELLDGAEERRTLDRIRSGDIRHCSIAFDPNRASCRYIGVLQEWTYAPLMEISLLDGRSPAWFGTSVRAIA